MLLLIVAACGKSEPANEGKRLPQPVPPPKTEIPKDLTVAVNVDGAEKTPITSSTLAKIEPDWFDAQRRAWRITRLIGVEESPRTSLAITGQHEITVEFPAASTAHTLVPALLLSQRGALVAEFIDPQNPFPKHHGAGGRLGRSPETEPRVHGVTKIEVRRR
jgi:hypothetical protein